MSDPTLLLDVIESTLDTFVSFGAPAQRHPITRSGERRPISRARRLGVYERDGYRCVWCGEAEQLQLDHVLPWSAGGSDHSENLRTLCRWCNGERSNLVDRFPTSPRVPVVKTCAPCNLRPADELAELVPAYCLACGTTSRARLERCM